jgi:3-hydroxyisobutyrate dehydrogenase
LVIPQRDRAKMLGKTIAFIGLGNMGGPMAANLVKAGHTVAGFDLVKSLSDEAKAAGVSIAPSAAHAVKTAEVIITMLPAGKQVVSVWTETVPAAANGALLIDCSTIDVDSARAAHALAAKLSLPSIDAPVSGGTAGARGATLTFMAGGTVQAFAAAKPILQTMGKSIIHCGEAGAGQATKICNNMMLAISMIGVSEAFVLAEKLGLSHQALFDVASTSSGQFLGADVVLSGARPSAGVARQQRLQAWLCDGADGEGSRPVAGLSQGRWCGDAARRPC